MTQQAIVFFDNASTTPIDPRVQKEMINAMEFTFGNPSSIHALGRQSRAKIEQARKIIAKGINASIGEIFFTSSASESNNTILNRCIIDQHVTRIITSKIEHPCVVNTVENLKKEKNIEVHFLNVSTLGNIDLEELNCILKEQPKTAGKTLVSLMMGNNEIGTMNDIATISRICKEYGALLHSDAVQALGKFPVNVVELGVDYLSGTAHKFHGPKGAAFMYISGENLIKPYIIGGSQERNMRAGTENIIGIVGLAKSFELAILEMNERKEKILSIREAFLTRLNQNFSDLEYNGDETSDFLYHILSVSFPASPKNEMLLYNLDINNICISAGSACSSGTNAASHVISNTRPDSERTTIRFSFSFLNTLAEVEYVIQKLIEIVN